MEKMKSSMSLNKALRGVSEEREERVSAEKKTLEDSPAAKGTLTLGSGGERRAKRQARLLNAIKILNHLSENKPVKEQIIFLFDSTQGTALSQKYQDIVLLLASIILFAKFEGDYSLLSCVRANISYQKTHIDSNQIWSAEVDLIEMFSSCVNVGYNFHSVY